MGEHHRAVKIFQSTITTELPSASRRGLGVCFARAALAHGGDHDVEHAAALGLETLGIGVTAGSGRIITTPNQLNNRLAPWNTVPAVSDLRTAMKDTIPRGGLYQP